MRYSSPATMNGNSGFAAPVFFRGKEQKRLCDSPFAIRGLGSYCLYREGFPYFNHLLLTQVTIFRVDIRETFSCMQGKALNNHSQTCSRSMVTICISDRNMSAVWTEIWMGHAGSASWEVSYTGGRRAFAGHLDISGCHHRRSSLIFFQPCIHSSKPRSSTRDQPVCIKF